jgi:hypothetical protein
MSRMLTVLASLAVAVYLCTGSHAIAGTTAADACKATKAKAAGSKAAALLRAFGKNFRRPNAIKLTSETSKAQSRFTKFFVRAESKGGCLSTGDAAVLEAKADAFVLDAVDIALAGRAGSEFQISTYTTDEQQDPDVALDANGDFVVVWESLGQDGDNWGVFGQRYDSTGTAVGAEFQINSYTTGQQRRPAVGMTADGDFVVVWDSAQNGMNVFGQRYDGAGAPVGAEFQINTYTTYFQWFPAVGVGADGDFVVVWESYQDGDGPGVFGQRYDSSGTAVGAEFQINSYTTGHQRRPAVGVAADGDFMVAWSSLEQDGDGSGVFGQRYDSTGAAAGSEFQINALTTGSQGSSAVGVDAGGNFVVVYGSSDQYGVGQNIFGQRYDNAGAAVGAAFQVNTYSSSEQTGPDVGVDPGGNFVVVWQSGHDAGEGYFGVFGQRYDAGGNPLGGEFHVNTYMSNAQQYPAVAVDADGNFAVVWQSDHQDGDARGVFGQRFHTFAE